MKRQIVMVFEYSQITFIKVVMDYLLICTNSVRVLVPIVKKYGILNLKRKNLTTTKKYFKVLRINGFQILDSTHYLHPTAFCYIRLEDENRKSTVKHNFKTKCLSGIYLNNKRCHGN